MEYEMEYFNNFFKTKILKLKINYKQLSCKPLYVHLLITSKFKCHIMNDGMK